MCTYVYMYKHPEVDRTWIYVRNIPGFFTQSYSIYSRMAMFTFTCGIHHVFRSVISDTNYKGLSLVSWDCLAFIGILPSIPDRIEAIRLGDS